MFDLNSSASWVGSLEDACSVAMMYASMGGYLGVMAKLGPFSRRDNCSLVRGVLERLITHLSVWSVHVWVLLGLLLGGSPFVVWVAVVLVEGVGSMGVAGTLEVVEVVEDVGEKLDGTFGCPLKLLEL